MKSGEPRQAFCRGGWMTRAKANRSHRLLLDNYSIEISSPIIKATSTIFNLTTCVIEFFIVLDPQDLESESCSAEAVPNRRFRSGSRHVIVTSFLPFFLNGPQLSRTFSVYESISNRKKSFQDVKSLLRCCWAIFD